MNAEPTADQKAEREEARELFFHEDDHAKDRTDWFFIGEVILIEAFLAGLSHGAAAPLVGALGLATSLLWLAVCSRQHFNLSDARDAFDRSSFSASAFRDRRKARDQSSRFRRILATVSYASRGFLIWLPSLFVLFWILGLIFYWTGWIKTCESEAPRLTPTLFERNQVSTPMAVGAVATMAAAAGPVPFSAQWSGDDDGWVAGFSDYPAGVEREWHFDSRRTAPPPPLSAAHKALFIGGDNHSDDLFMFWKRRVEGLVPGQSYAATIEVVFGSDAPKSCQGVGGAPGESVFVKVGASAAEPLTTTGKDGAVTMTIDKGNQAIGGKDAVVVGNVATTNADCKHRRWEEKTLANKMPQDTKADPSGAVWVIVSTDSGFEARTEMYYELVRLRLDPK